MSDGGAAVPSGPSVAVPGRVGAFVDANTVAGRRYTPEVCVIGSGAGGAVSAAILAAGGRDVLVVEEGGHRTRRDFNMREDVAFKQLYQEGGTRATKDTGIALLQGRTVGGTTVVNWTTCFRTPETVLEHWRTRFGVSGFSRAELDPHWDAVEQRLSIAEIPLAESNRNNRLLYDGCTAIGMTASPTRRNVKQCMKSGYCGMGCPVDAKQSMLITYLPDAVARGATVLYRCRIDRLEIEGGRVIRARGVVLGDDAGRTPTGGEIVIEAKRFIVAGGAINSPSLLLRSGLGGADTPIGRRTFLHPVVSVTGDFDEPVESFYGAPQSIASHALARQDRLGSDEIGLFFEAAPVHPVIASLATSGFGAGHRAAMARLSHVTAHIVLAIDGFHPEEEGGTVTLRPSGAALVDYPIPERVWRGLREGTRKLVEIDLAAGARSVSTGHEPAVVVRSKAEIARIDDAHFDTCRVSVFSAHQMGGCAMGSDPARSVVRPGDLRHHTVENLHVIDGSVFPTSLGVNPQESIYGLAHLVATRLHAAWA